MCIRDRVRQIGMPMKFSAMPGRMRRVAPEFGEHTDEILKTIGYSRSKIKILREKGVI